MDLLLNLGHSLAGAGKDAAEVPELALPPDSIGRDDARERPERQEQGSRRRRMPHGELPSKKTQQQLSRRRISKAMAKS
jgi:hypothetical protein